MEFPTAGVRDIGQCLSDGSACTGHSQCTSSEYDHCIAGYTDSGATCFQKGSNCEMSVTFIFGRDYATGTFVDGQPYVVADATGTVEIDDISPPPATAGCRDSGGSNCIALDMKAGEYGLHVTASKSRWAATTPELPDWVIDVSDGRPRCIMKAIQDDGPRRQALLWIATLTVVKQAPPAAAFRPNCEGVRKIGFEDLNSDGDYLDAEEASWYLKSTVDGRLNLIPTIDSAVYDKRAGGEWTNAPGIGGIAFFLRGLHTGHTMRNSDDSGSETLHGACIFCDAGVSGTHADAHLDKTNVSHNYHAGRSNRWSGAFLRMMWDDFDPMENPSQRQVVYDAVQRGLDKIGVLMSGSDERVNLKRHKNMAAPAIFAAFMLNDAGLVDAEKRFPNFRSKSVNPAGNEAGFVEFDSVIDTPKGVQIFGNGGCGEDDWWATHIEFLRGDASADQCKWQGDPYGYVDQLYNSYNRAASHTWCGSAVAMKLLQADSFVRQAGVQKWVKWCEHWLSGQPTTSKTVAGWRTTPDPCAPVPASVVSSSCLPPNCSGYGSTWGPAPGNSADCPTNGACACIEHGGNPMTDGRLPDYTVEMRWHWPWQWEMAAMLNACSDPDDPDFPCTGVVAREGDPTPPKLPAAPELVD